MRKARENRSFLQRIARDRGGAVMVWVGVAMIPVIGMLGVATDAARGYLVKARLSQALDAAGLAGAQSMHDSVLLAAEIQKYFDANFPPGFMGATVTGPTFSVGPNQETLTLSANASIDTSFMRVLGKDVMPVASTTEITRKTQFMEVVLAIDMSGSMGSWTGGKTRIQSAREAAVELVNILFGENATKDLLKIGVVPWNGKVNVTRNGEAYTGTTTEIIPAYNRTPVFKLSKGPPTYHTNSKVMTKLWYANNSPVPLSRNPQANWSGCVYSRFVVTDDGIPGNDADIIYGPLDSPNGDWRGWEPIREDEGEPVSGGTCEMNAAFGTGECTSCLSHGITPLSNTKQTLIDAINELTSPTGTTNITQGLGWAWRVLMPEAPFTEAFTDEEVANGGGSRVRAIILLTDGENFGGSGDGYKAVFGTGTGGGTGPAMDGRLTQLAANVKAGGTLIYTIQFANAGGALETLMKNVATEPKAPYYHYAPDGDTLKAVFKQVANALSELRVSK